MPLAEPSRARSPRSFLSAPLFLGICFLLAFSHDPSDAASAAPAIPAAPVAPATPAAAAAPAAPGPLAEGLALFREGRSAQAQPLLEEGLKISPDHLEGILALVEIHGEQENYERAIPLAEHAVALAPGSSRAHFLLAESYGTKAEKVSKLRAAFLAGNIKREFETAVSLDPKSIEAREGLMGFYVIAPSIMGGSLTKAREQAEAIVPLDPVRGLTDVAQVAHQQGKDSDVLAALDRMAKVDPAKASLGRAMFYTEKKDEARAVAELLEVTERKPRVSKDIIQAASLLQQLKRWDEALRVLSQVEVEDPGYLAASYQIGRVCLLSKKDLPRAEGAFKKYLSAPPPPKEAPSRAAAHWRLGQVYQEMGRKEDARRELEEAVRGEPKNEEFRKSLSAVK